MTELEKLDLKIAKLIIERKEIIKKLQRECDHDYIWHYIAGEGRICKKRNYHDLDCSD